MILSSIRRELENILLLVDELEDKGVLRNVVNEIIVDEFKKTTKKDEPDSEDERS